MRPQRHRPAGGGQRHPRHHHRPRLPGPHLEVQVDGKQPRELTLPGWYLDGRQRTERNRRVDLAYATSGHRAQGLTRWRALVRLTGTEDSNWLSIRPLRHSDLQALLAHLDHHHKHDDEDEGLLTAPAGGRLAAGGPRIAVRVRASVGRPGASAHAEYQRRRAAEHATWTHSLTSRVAVVLAAGATTGLLGAQLAPHLAGLLALITAAGLGWRLRFHPSADTLAWRRGATGERRTARLLAPLERRGWAVLHDLAIPGTAANIDHLVIGPGGVVVIDSKQYRGRLRLDAYGMVWHGRHLRARLRFHAAA